MRRKSKTESRQRNNRSLNTVGIFPKPADRNERVPTILCLICEFNYEGKFCGIWLNQRDSA
jgi:hypothetical protein